MAGVLVNGGEDLMLGLLVNKGTGYTLQSLSLRLFKSNSTPVEATVASDLTVADFTGYGNIALTGSSWTLTPGAPSQASYAQQTFTSTAGAQSQAVYGYYLVNASDGTLVAAERFTDGPYTIVNDGDAIKVTPVITQS